MAGLLLAPAALAISIAGAGGAADPAGRSGCAASAPYSEPIAAAAARFRLPGRLIAAVIRVESNGFVRAVSPKGALGLMQLMPQTWASLRLRYALGLDPFDPCDNILAGAAYLRELLDRYGDPGFLAAYNAGPVRYQSYLSGATPLPAETIDYVARLVGRSTFGATAAIASNAAKTDAWRAAELFVGQPRSRPAIPAASPHSPGSVTPQPPAAAPIGIAADPIFIARTGTPR